MIEAYLGKDYARRAPSNIDGDDGIFSTQKSLKELYPLSTFTKGHLAAKDYKKVEALGVGYDYRGATNKLEI